MPEPLMPNEIAYLLAVAGKDRARWQRRCDDAASHSAILRREAAAASVARFDRLIAKLEAMQEGG